MARMLAEIPLEVRHGVENGACARTNIEGN